MPGFPARRTIRGMKRLPLVLVLALAGIAAASATAAPPSIQVVIRHQMSHCHTWSAANGPWLASQRITTTAGARLTIVDNDVMPHQLIQLSGPKATLVAPNMHKMGAKATVTFPKKGTYVFKTKAGEDYTSGVKTTGEDNVLRMVVVVH